MKAKRNLSFLGLIALATIALFIPQKIEAATHYNSCWFYPGKAKVSAGGDCFWTNDFTYKAGADLYYAPNSKSSGSKFVSVSSSQRLGQHVVANGANAYYSICPSNSSTTTVYRKNISTRKVTKICSYPTRYGNFAEIYGSTLYLGKYDTYSTQIGAD